MAINRTVFFQNATRDIQYGCGYVLIPIPVPRYRYEAISNTTLFIIQYTNNNNHVSVSSPPVAASSAALLADNCSDWSNSECVYKQNSKCTPPQHLSAHHQCTLPCPVSPTSSVALESPLGSHQLRSLGNLCSSVSDHSQLKLSGAHQPDSTNALSIGRPLSLSSSERDSTAFPLHVADTQ